MSSRFLIAGRYFCGQVVALVESVPRRCPRGTLVHPQDVSRRCRTPSGSHPENPHGCIHGGIQAVNSFDVEAECKRLFLLLSATQGDLLLRLQCIERYLAWSQIQKKKFLHLVNCCSLTRSMNVRINSSGS